MAEARRYAVGIQPTRSAPVINSAAMSGRAMLIADPIKGKINVAALDAMRMAGDVGVNRNGGDLCPLGEEMFILDRVKSCAGNPF